MSIHRSGKKGPNTPKGKLASSQNSKKHGLTSKQLHDPADIQLAGQWEKEINDYYQPKSPFAKILSHQVASYVVKSKRIKELEQLELQQRVYELEHSPEMILETMPFIKGTAKGMLLELIRYNEIRLPCGLTHQQLNDIVKQIDQFYGEIHGEDDVLKAFPRLVEYLNAQSFFKENESDEALGTDDKLKIIAEKIEGVLSQGESYSEYLKHLFNRLAKPVVPEESSEGIDELQSHLRDTQERHQAERLARHGTLPEPVPKKFVTHTTFMNRLKCFNDLFIALCFAMKWKESYDQKKAFMIASVALPAERSDLLMRYQTTTDRRLSGLIAEYLLVQDRDRADEATI